MQGAAPGAGDHRCLVLLALDDRLPREGHHLPARLARVLHPAPVRVAVEEFDPVAFLDRAGDGDEDRIIAPILLACFEELQGRAFATATLRGQREISSATATWAVRLLSCEALPAVAIANQPEVSVSRHATDDRAPGPERGETKCSPMAGDDSMSLSRRRRRSLTPWSVADAIRQPRPSTAARIPTGNVIDVFPIWLAIIRAYVVSPAGASHRPAPETRAVTPARITWRRAAACARAGGNFTS